MSGGQDFLTRFPVRQPHQHDVVVRDFPVAVVDKKRRTGQKPKAQSLVEICNPAFDICFHAHHVDADFPTFVQCRLGCTVVPWDSSRDSMCGTGSIP